MISAPIYKRDTAGKIRTWQYEVEGDRYRTIAGIKGGNLVTAGWTKCKPKNEGRANATTATEQAWVEAVAEEGKKLKREYRRTITELSGVPCGPMLAQSYDKLKKPLTFPVWSQPKLDGIRAMVSKGGAFSRELQPHFNCDHILASLAPFFEKNPDVTLDGEFYNHGLKDDFNKIVSVVRKQKPTIEQRAEAAKLIQYHVYDMIAPNWPAPFETRSQWLSANFTESDAVKLVQTQAHEDQAALDRANGEYTEDGYEGQMVRLNWHYEVDTRSSSLLKRKDGFVTEEFPIKRIEEGLGNWAGYAKRVVLDILDAPGGEVGAGMRGNQEFAKNLLANKDKFKLATIRHFGRTPDGSLRFPVAIDFHTAEGRVD